MLPFPCLFLFSHPPCSSPFLLFPAHFPLHSLLPLSRSIFPSLPSSHSLLPLPCSLIPLIPYSAFFPHGRRGHKEFDRRLRRGPPYAPRKGGAGTVTCA
ncbi:unnamed protein product [Schistocephalus solidus]|uniref:Uncharacterized protein n=1 Tax=Schistocephalus solidus TaxID=70667 RepID=A0A3P7BNN9_SCHSO|nr:unnamed protein product [Schistocephalus solidus]